MDYDRGCWFTYIYIHDFTDTFIFWTRLRTWYIFDAATDDINVQHTTPLDLDYIANSRGGVWSTLLSTHSRQSRCKNVHKRMQDHDYSVSP